MKKSVIEELRTKRGMSAADASNAIDTVFESVKTVVERDGSVSIPGFGTFRRSFHDERMARNPRTGEPVKVAAHHKIKFSEPRQRTR